MSSQYSINTNDEYVLLECTPTNFIKWLVESSEHWRNIGFRPEIYPEYEVLSTYVYEKYANILIGERLSDHVLEKLWNHWITNYKNMRSFNRSNIEEGEYQGYKLKFLQENCITPIEKRSTPSKNKYNTLPSSNNDVEQYFYLFEHMDENNTLVGGKILGELDLVKSNIGFPIKFVKICNIPNLT